jgi:hypothetical protein
MAPGRTVARPAAPVVTVATDWMNSCSSPAYGGTDVYLARSTIRRIGDRATMWDMYDFKNTQVADGIRYLSTKNQHEYDCKSKQRRMLSTTGFSGHMGKGSVVATDGTAFPWERVPAGDFVDTCYLKFVCGK